jgi:hypothetical protein
MAQPLYQISWTSVQPLSSYYMRNGRWCHHEGWRHQSLQVIMGNGVMAEDDRLTSWLWVSVTVVLLIAGNQEVLVWSNVQWQNVHTKFHAIASSRSWVILCVRWRHHEHRSTFITEFADQWKNFHPLEFVSFPTEVIVYYCYYWYNYYYYVKWYWLVCYLPFFSASVYVTVPVLTLKLATWLLNQYAYK